MNIQEAKEEIRKTVEIYLEKDDFGEYAIPFMKQRPIFMIGAPGIGKTAVVEQIAAEMGIGLVSYSMTHHTRQSAIGLPYIVKKEYGGEELRVSEYTLSEIIASVHEVIDKTGRTEGILFLDEINCVSETLAPAILQFLQYKTFGGHSLPKGWVVVSAGNPPQYNRSVREFDIATRDRLKYITVEEDYEVWKKYAYDRGIHAAIIAFLEVNRSWFYSIKTTIDGPRFATARGWEDLSYAVKMYERKGFEVGASFIGEYITDMDIARKFAVFYDLFKKYREDYQVVAILEGKQEKKVEERAAAARFDERIALIEMIAEALGQEFGTVLEEQAVLEGAAAILRVAKKEAGGTESARALHEKVIERESVKKEEEISSGQRANSMSADEIRIGRKVIRELGDYQVSDKAADATAQFALWKKKFDQRAKKQARQLDSTGDKLENAFSFMENVWGEGQELTYFMTILTSGHVSSSFLAKHGSPKYFEHNKNLLLFDVKEQLRKEILLL